MNNYSPEEQLSFLKLKCKRLAPEIYRAYALYIQNIRLNLKKTVKDVVYTIIIENFDIEIQSLKLKSHKSLQRNINELVDKTNSLLTVEHLLDLSLQMEQEITIKRELAKNQLINSLDKAKVISKVDEESIELNMRPPIDNPQSINSWLSSDFDSLIENIDNTTYEDPSDYEQYSFEDELKVDSVPVDNNNEKDLSESNRKDLDIFRSIFFMAGDALSAHNSKKINKVNEVEQTTKISLKDSDKNFLPENPKSLLSWTNSIENALIRRLIDLSHAINMQLLKEGLINTLLPLNLLEAVSKGQVETLDSFPNLLKIRVPIQSPYVDDNMEIICLLLKPSEFEYQQPVLRRCRSHLKHNRFLLFKMVKQYRHWQSRLVAKEAQQQWWKNS